MLLKLTSFLFNMVIGKLPPEKRDKYKKELSSLLVNVVKAGAEGAAKGLRDAN